MGICNRLASMILVGTAIMACSVEAQAGAPAGSKTAPARHPQARKKHRAAHGKTRQLVAAKKQPTTLLEGISSDAACLGSGKNLAQIQTVIAVQENNVTWLNVSLTGATLPTLLCEGKRITLTVPNSAPGPHLAENLASGGLVSRIALLTPTPGETRLQLDLSELALAELAPSAAQTLRLRLTPYHENVVHQVKATAPGLYDIVASGADVNELLKSLAHDSGVSLVLAGATPRRVTVELHGATVEKAMDLLTRSAGLAYHHEGETYIVGTVKEIEAGWPKAQPEPVKPAAPVVPVMKQEVYHCRNISASELVVSLEKMFEKEQLRVSTGAAAISPRLDATTTAEVTGVQSSAIGAKSSGGTVETGLSSRDVILYGEQSVVARAMALMQQLDRRRQQVRISVRITDISLDALKELGVQWNWSSFKVSETAPSGINFGTFSHTPVNIEATLSALETHDRAKLLAAPTLSMLDGERAFILIGERLLFPKLIGYTQASTPIFDKEEQRVGIYLQVAAQMSGDNEVTLTIYPQVSVVSGYLNVSNASYPQISTREQQTTIRVKDGEKIIVGGLIRDEELNSLQSVPILSRIPFFGELFTWRKKTHNKSEVVIMITPELLKD